MDLRRPTGGGVQLDEHGLSVREQKIFYGISHAQYYCQPNEGWRLSGDRWQRSNAQNTQLSDEVKTAYSTVF